MKFPQILLTFYKESNPTSHRSAWANYNDDGAFINVTNIYGEEIPLSEGNKVCIDNDIWILKDHLHEFYY